MKKSLILCLALSLLGLQTSFAQGRANDIPVGQLPREVRQVLEAYVALLRNSANLTEAGGAFEALAGGGLVNEDGSLRNSVLPYGLKKDFENIKFYANPIKITRVNFGPARSSGFGPTAIRGRVYKIWLAKASGVAGMPAPVSILVPENHPDIKAPKIINIGSF